MCGRTTLTNQRLEDIAELLDAEFSPEDLALYRPRYNVAPSDTTWIAVSRGDARFVEPAVWGYVASKKPLINVRGEQVASGAGFRDAFASRRCAIVTDGFYEWPPATGGARAAPRAPYWFHRPEGGLILLAGLFQRAPAEAPGPPRFTILTTRPNAIVARVHDRMPVVLPQAHLDDWLAGPPARATPLIAPAPDDWLIATRVSRRANSPRNDDAACLTPATEADDDPQRSLF
jgi:putative SOS response-associated peptidase YedK